MLCPFCYREKAEGGCNECVHLTYTETKTYAQYLEESKASRKRMVKEFGAPPGAKPPTPQQKPSDTQIRTMLYGRKRIYG